MSQTNMKNNIDTIIMFFRILRLKKITSLGLISSSDYYLVFKLFIASSTVSHLSVHCIRNPIARGNGAPEYL